MVIDECRSLAAKWERITGFLGLQASLIDEIKQNRPNDAADCWNDALKQWIAQNYNTVKYGKPSWKTLLKAITKVDRLQAKKLAAQYQGMKLMSTDSLSVGSFQDVPHVRSHSEAGSY